MCRASGLLCCFFLNETDGFSLESFFEIPREKKEEKSCGECELILKKLRGEDFVKLKTDKDIQ